MEGKPCIGCAICSAAFVRLSVLHRTCGKILYWDDSEYWEEGWEAEEWEWERKELEDAAEAQNTALPAARLREQELAFAWRLAKCRQVPKEALRPIEMIRPPYVGHHTSDQYDQCYSWPRAARRS